MILDTVSWIVVFFIQNLDFERKLIFETMDSLWSLECHMLFSKFDESSRNLLDSSRTINEQTLWREFPFVFQWCSDFYLEKTVFWRPSRSWNQEIIVITCYLRFKVIACCVLIHCWHFRTCRREVLHVKVTSHCIFSHLIVSWCIITAWTSLLHWNCVHV